MKEELLPCPFCGGEAASIIMHGWYYVYCKDCQNRTDNHGQKEHAIKAWNTRTTPDRWISVEENLPPKGKDFLSWNGADVFLMNGQDLKDWKIYTPNITHWQPLPKSPEAR